jgi:hypothetical protein
MKTSKSRLLMFIVCYCSERRGYYMVLRHFGISQLNIWAVFKTPVGWFFYRVLLSNMLGIITIHYCGKSYEQPVLNSAPMQVLPWLWSTWCQIALGLHPVPRYVPSPYLATPAFLSQFHHVSSLNFSKSIRGAASIGAPICVGRQNCSDQATCLPPMVCSAYLLQIKRWRKVFRKVKNCRHKRSWTADRTNPNMSKLQRNRHKMWSPGQRHV